MNPITRPNLVHAPSWYPYFFTLATGNDLIAALKDNKQQVLDLLNSIPTEAMNFRYAPDKWTIKQIFIHLADEERYYAYKAFCCSRQAPAFLETPMGETYTQDFNAENRTIADIREELVTVREATISLFNTITIEMLDYKDLSQKDIYTARSVGWFTVGHSQHHLGVIRNKYLTQV